jgi:hypothetical protein
MRRDLMELHHHVKQAMEQIADGHEYQPPPC